MYIYFLLNCRTQYNNRGKQNSGSMIFANIVPEMIITVKSERLVSSVSSAMMNT